jgi:outer membrane cobalamin receptor
VSAAELVSQANQFLRNFQTATDGRYVAQDLPFGIYRLSVTHEGFAPSTGLVEIRSEVPVSISVTLGVAPVTTQVVVSDSATLVNPYLTGAVRAIGSPAISEQLSAQAGRDIADLVDSQPGWLYEANGILHPRGSEYDVQFVVDGLPLTQNRSAAFAPSFESDEVESMRVLTAGYPAEYGRKLGGVVEITTPKDSPSGLHGQFNAAGGSFSTASADAGLTYASGANRFAVSGNGFHTDRYLDPPVLSNFTNRGNASGISASYERDLSARDRLRLNLTHEEVRFLVPNNLAQQDAGQRQDLSNVETGEKLYYQHMISTSLLLSAEASVRDASALLSSNPFSTPLIISQDRGYREGYARVDLAGHHGRHDWKAGADAIFAPVHETMQYQITDSSQFDPGTQPQFQFSDRRWDREPAAFVQDQVRLGNWNVSAGLRFDHYGFVVNQSAWSPRVGISRYVAPLNLLAHATYDRIFQTPAMENLLLASSPELNTVSSEVLRLPVQPARGNYYEVGATNALFGRLRLDVNVFRRDFHNFSDDDTLFDTGVSFPISFSKGRILGEEVRLDVPGWGRFSGFLSYSNQTVTGQGPITGGLFLGEEAADEVSDTSKFAGSSDQRNTLRTRVRFQATRRCWLALGAEYGSGMPVEVDPGSVDFDQLLAQYGQAILDQVDFARQRTRPNYSLDAALGADIYHKERRNASLQIQLGNLTDHVNVINFASLLSGTAVGAPRSVSARLKVSF